MSDPARVTVFGLGGTISMTRTPTGGVAPALSSAEIVASVPGLAAAGIEVTAVDLRQPPGASLTLADLHDLSARIEAGTATGVVVTQGTDTIEETAYLLDLWHTGPAPVVVTGAMRNPTMAGHDGPANLLGAIRTAAAPQCRDLGALVVFADDIHAASRVRKTHATGIGAFSSPNGGPLGHLAEGRPHLFARPARRFTLPRPAVPGPARVGLATIAFGDTGDLLAGAADRLDALVVAAMGAGHVPEPVVSTLEDLAARIPVVLASRTGAGPVLTDTYHFPGSEHDLIHRGLVPAGYLDAAKARMLLYALVQLGADRRTIADAFADAGGVPVSR